jgi:hypothetical protein
MLPQYNNWSATANQPDVCNDRQANPGTPAKSMAGVEPRVQGMTCNWYDNHKVRSYLQTSLL